MEDLLSELLEEDTIGPEEAVLAGVDPADSNGLRELQRKLAEWDYTVKQSAKIAYTEPSIERLQLPAKLGDYSQMAWDFPLYLISLSRGEERMLEALPKRQDMCFSPEVV